MVRKGHIGVDGHTSWMTRNVCMLVWTALTHHADDLENRIGENDGLPILMRLTVAQGPELLLQLGCPLDALANQLLAGVQFLPAGLAARLREQCRVSHWKLKGATPCGIAGAWNLQNRPAEAGQAELPVTLTLHRRPTHKRCTSSRVRILSVHAATAEVYEAVTCGGSALL